MARLKVFVVEDEEILRVTLTDDLQDAGYEVEAFADPRKALQAVETSPVDVIISDIKMPGMDGLELLTRIKAIKPETQVVLMTAYGSVESAVEAMKKGAYDYITKPFNIDEMLLRLERIKELRTVKQENRRLRTQIASRYTLEALVGKSSAIQQTRQLVQTVAETPTTVLITGETGTGKELLANILHYTSDRRDKPLIKVSCAMLARDVFESELFGHEKGAFTGATQQKPGRFELADGGTLYLDDVDDIPLELQVKLLRALEEQEFERVGGTRTIRVDVRVVASTKADLKKLVAEGRFREDLYYRLNVFPIHLAPLRERREDIPLLVEHFCRELAPGRTVHFRPEVLECLSNYAWPGNVRELRNVVERLILLSKDREVDLSHVPIEILQPNGVAPEVCLGQKPLNAMLEDIEVNLLRQALQMSGGNQTRAAEMLGIPPSTLRTKMSKYGLKEDGRN
ncbi:MAG: sigma-54-dependent Fis family transcriptional regulator [Calditrichaeota bacterium]|nr:MAG: sigma-54-dependent Fis family transcriptional regulator [Calditrichota bacterium]